MEKIIISIKDGIIVDVEAPDYVDVIIRDYDIPRQGGYVDLENYEIKTDEDGDEYVETVW